MNITIFANAFHIVSGGDKIFAEYAKRWKKSGETIRIVTNEKGKQFCLRHGIRPTDITVWRASKADRWGVFGASVYKTFTSLVRAIRTPLEETEVVFAASFLWPDLIPALIAKFTDPTRTLVVAWYIFAPAPWSVRYQGSFINGLVFYLMQQISYVLVTLFADRVLTAAVVDVPKFERFARLAGNVAAIRGGIDYQLFANTPKQKKVYDGVFVGRFHPQKNVDDLITLWAAVVAVRPHAQLAIVGTGYLKKKLIARVRSLGLRGNVQFLGSLDGKEKAAVLASSKLFLSASQFDSGNIALDEALATGIPGVVYDLPELEYDGGVVRVPVGNGYRFIQTILSLLTNEKRRNRLAREGKRAARAWDWNTKAIDVWSIMQPNESPRYSYA